MQTPTFSQLLDLSLLDEAWQYVRDKNSGGGIDRQSVAQFGENANEYLAELSTMLKEGSYVPEPYLQIVIPKDDNQHRVLGLPTIRDKILQQAVKMLIEPILEKNFLDVSYGYRTGKGAYKAIQRTRDWIRRYDLKYVLKCDIDSYFDNIPHNPLLKRLSKLIPDAQIIELVRLWIKMAKIGTDLTWREVEKGVPQGSVISPLLSNLYLHDFDVFVKGRKWAYVRYADDFLILTHSKAQAETAFQAIENYLKSNLALSLNAEHAIIPIAQGCEFLGVKIVGTDVIITDEKKQSLCQKAKDNFRLENERFHPDFLATLRSIGAYYGKLIPQSLLETIDTHTQAAITLALREELKKKTLHRTQIVVDFLEPIAFASEKYRNEKSQYLAQMAKDIRSRSYGKTLKEQKNSSQAEKESLQKIEKKKKEYNEKAAEARELLLTQSGIFVGKSKGKVVVKQNKATIQEIPFQHLDNITIQAHGVLLSTDLIYACAEHKINFQLLDFEGNPYAYIMSNTGLSAEIGLAQLKGYENHKAQDFALAITEGKIRNQITLLKYFQKSARSPKNASDEHVVGMGSILEEIAELQDLPLAELRQQLLSIEGRAAFLYWDFVKNHLLGYADFTGRIRQGATDPVNSALNYGYGILYGRIFEAVVRAKLHPCLSYLHVPSDLGVPTLTFDLIEEFRPQAVDKPILGMIRKEFVPVIENGKLNEESRKRIAVKVLERLAKYEHFNKQDLRLHDIIMAQARNFAKFLTNENPKYKPYLGTW